jgi:two-component system response regulator YesN
VLERLCSRSGFNVFSAATLQEGLHFLETTPSDAIISDITLPDGTGYELMNEARRRGIHALGIALSAYNYPRAVEEAKMTGFDHHLQKPFDRAQLRSPLEQRKSSGY